MLRTDFFGSQGDFCRFFIGNVLEAFASILARVLQLSGDSCRISLTSLPESLLGRCIGDNLPLACILGSADGGEDMVGGLFCFTLKH